jgi:hypothetical protein
VQRLDEFTARYRGQPRDVPHRLLGVERRDLAADLGKGVHQDRAQAPEAGAEGAVQAGGSGADDR